MAEVNFNALTADNGAIRSLRELLFMTTYKESDIAALVTVKTGQKNGGKMDWLNLLSGVPAGVKSTGCEVTWSKFSPKGAEKEWEMGKYVIPIEICADEFDGTIAEYAENKGIDVDKLEGTEILSEVVLPIIEKSVREAVFRIAFFGDTNADNFSNGGHITNGLNLDLFNVTDGLFVKFAAIVANDSDRLTAIAANAQATYSAQKAAIYGNGVATGIMDSIIADADPRVKQNNGIFFMTDAFFNALQVDYEKQHAATMPYELVEEGRIISRYRGLRIVTVPEWDACINAYENDGTKWHNPYRVVFTPRENLFVGTSDSDVFAKIDLSFDARNRTNLLYAKSDLATNVGEDDLVQVAY